MGIFDDDGDLFGKKKPYSQLDKFGGQSGTMSAINKHRSGGLGHGLSIGQQIAADGASDDVDALFVGKPKDKKGYW